MRFWAMFVLILSVSYSATGQNNKKHKDKTIVEYITPPGVTHIYDNVFIDETEISNISYLEYMFTIEKDSSRNFYLSQWPDSTCWQKKLQFKDSIDPYIYHYLRYPGFRYFPVIGVSYEQALNYCKWRGDIVSQSYREGNLRKENPKSEEYEITVEYRLPTKEEWEFAASGGLDLNEYPYGMIRPLKDKYYTFKIGANSFTCLDKNNIKYSKEDILHRVEFNVYDEYYFGVKDAAFRCSPDTSFQLGYIYEFPPNNLGIYNIIGNVAEMTSSKGIAKGGSFKSKLSECAVKTDFAYDQPKEWLGFRCIAIVHMRKK